MNAKNSREVSEKKIEWTQMKKRMKEDNRMNINRTENDGKRKTMNVNEKREDGRKKWVLMNEGHTNIFWVRLCFPVDQPIYVAPFSSLSLSLVLSKPALEMLKKRSYW